METFFYVLGYPDNDTGYQLVMDLKDKPNTTLISEVFYKKIYGKIYDIYQPRRNRIYVKILKAIIPNKAVKNLIFSHCYKFSQINFRITNNEKITTYPFYNEKYMK